MSPLYWGGGMDTSASEPPTSNVSVVRREPLVILDGVNKHFGELHALNDINTVVTAVRSSSPTRWASPVLAGCAGTGAPAADPTLVASFTAGSTMAKLSEAGKITIGTKFDKPLFGLKRPDVPVGFDVEIGKLIAASLGIKPSRITFSETVSANREPFIESGQVDLVIATYTIIDTRKEAVSCSGPYYSADQSILVKADNKSIKSEKDLVGQPVCSVTGSAPPTKLAEIGAKPLLTDTYSNCLEPLRAGAVVAVSTDNLILAGLTAQNEREFKIAGKVLPYVAPPAVDNYSL